jgi:predicted transcriptional regulator
MSATITIEHARKIISKLRAKKSSYESKHHKYFDLIVDGKVVLTFGVSHTKKDGKPQSHLPEQLRLNAYDTRRQAQCPLSVKDYLKVLEDLGLL